MVEEFLKRKDDLVKYANKDHKIMIDNILDFQDHATALLGISISDFINYIIHKYSLSKFIGQSWVARDKHTVKYEELERSIKPWAVYYSKTKQNMQALVISSQNYPGYDSDFQSQAGRTFMVQDQYFAPDDEALNTEREHYKSQGSSVIRFKLSKHEYKIQEILQENAIEGDSNMVSVKQLPRVFKDLSYLCGFIIQTFEEILSNDFIVDGQGQQKQHHKNTTPKAIEEFAKYVWLREHDKKLTKRAGISHSCFKLPSKDEWPDLGTVTDGTLENRENRVVFFEDELYLNEKSDLSFNIQDFRRYLQEFIDKDETHSIAIDLTNEFQQVAIYQMGLEGKNLDYIFPSLPLVVPADGQVDDFDFIKENLERTLNQYQRFYEMAEFKSDEERTFISDLIKQLQSQLDQYQSKAAQQQHSQNALAVYSGIPKIKDLNPKSKFQRALQEIFYFYSRQHKFYCPTFQDMLDDATHMRNGEFVMFCKDFSIPITKERAVTVFNKISEFHKPISFDQFILLLDKLAEELNDFKLEQMHKKAKIVNKLIKQQNKKIKSVKSKFVLAIEDKPKKSVKFKDENDDNDEEKDDDNEKVDDDNEIKQEDVMMITQNTQNLENQQDLEQRKSKLDQQLIQLHYERDRIDADISKCKVKSLDQCNQELIEMLELADQKAYRSKMRGVVLKPFQMKDQTYRIQKLPDDILRKRMQQKVRTSKEAKSADDIKKKVEAMKQERLRRQNERESSQQQELRDKEKRKREALTGRMDSETGSRQSRITTHRAGQKSPLDNLITGNQQEAIPEEDQQVKRKGQPIFITLNDLDRMNVKQFNRNIRADFKPADFLFDTEDEDSAPQPKKKAKVQEHVELSKKIKQPPIEEKPSQQLALVLPQQKRGGHQVANQSEIMGGMKTHRVGPIKASHIDITQEDSILKQAKQPLTARNKLPKKGNVNESQELMAGYNSQNEGKPKKLLQIALNKKSVQQSVDLTNKPGLKHSKSQAQVLPIQQAAQNMSLVPAKQSYKTDKIIARANEIEKQTSKKNIQSMQDILKLHDRQVNKGLKTLIRK